MNPPIMCAHEKVLKVYYRDNTDATHRVWVQAGWICKTCGTVLSIDFFDEQKGG